MFNNKGASVAIIFVVVISLLSGCSSTSTIQYQHIPGTSEEFSQDVYNVLRDFEHDLSNPKDSYNINLSHKFLEKYENKILNIKEQQIYLIVKDSILVTGTYTLEGFDEKDHIEQLKKNAEKILKAIEN